MKAINATPWFAVLACTTLCAVATPTLADDATTAATVPYVVPRGVPDYIKAAIADPTRPAEQRARDVNRKPAELLALSHIKPGDKVVEFASFGQYMTPMLCDIVGPKGKVYMFDLPYTEKRAGEASRKFVAAHPNAQYQLVNYNDIQLPQHLDVIYMVMYYHDLSINHIDVAKLNEKIFKALKPGGVYFIVDHNAAPGSGRRDTNKLHRIDPATIESEVKAAGFRLIVESNLLARPSDDHTQIVFAPGLRGLTDQTVFTFEKPRN